MTAPKRFPKDSCVPLLTVRVKAVNPGKHHIGGTYVFPPMPIGVFLWRMSPRTVTVPCGNCLAPSYHGRSMQRRDFPCDDFRSSLYLTFCHRYRQQRKAEMYGLCA